MTTHLTLVRHLILGVHLHHVLHQRVLAGEAVGADLTHVVTPLLEMNFLLVILGLHLAVEVFVTIFTLTQVSHVNGRISVSLNMKMKVLHELQIVHEQFPADTAFEGHVSLEL